MNTITNKLAEALRAMEAHMARVHDGYPPSTASQAVDSARQGARAALAEYDAQEGAEPRVVMAELTAMAKDAAEDEASGWLPEVQRTAPECIYLTVSDNPHDAEKPFPADYGNELCWCQDEAVSVCVPYVRADLAALRDEAGEAVAWLADDGTGRVIDAKAKAAGSRAAATGSATAVYSIPLYTRPAPAAEAAPQGGREVCGAPRDGRTCYPDCDCETEALCDYGTVAATPPSAPTDADVVWALDFLDGLNCLGLSRAAGTGLRNVAALIRRLSAPAPQGGVDGESLQAARVLADFAKTAPGRLPERVTDAIAVVDRLAATPPSAPASEAP
jgi:hypothetical protein